MVRRETGFGWLFKGSGNQLRELTQFGAGSYTRDPAVEFPILQIGAAGAGLNQAELLRAGFEGLKALGFEPEAHESTAIGFVLDDESDESRVGQRENRSRSM